MVLSETKWCCDSWKDVGEYLNKFWDLDYLIHSIQRGIANIASDYLWANQVMFENFVACILHGYLLVIQVPDLS